MPARRGLPLPVLSALALGALTLAACDGASPAGGDLIGQGGEPVVNEIALADLAATDAPDGSFGAALGAQATQSRVLAGRVADPLFGDVAATAYVDFARPALPESFRNATPTSVSLILPFGLYAYGDPEADVTLGIAQVTEAWRPTRDGVELEGGTAIATGAPFSTVTAPDTSRTLTVPLSAAWVTGSGSLLTSPDSVYTDAFKGLALLPPDLPSAVRGITATGVRLQVVVAEDTLSYFANEVYTYVDAAAPPAEAAGVPVRDGTGRALGLTLPLDADSLRGSALSQARLVVRLDTAALQADALTRPIPTALSLVGVRDDSTRALLNNAAVVDGEAIFSGTTVTNVVQDAIFGAPLFERYDVIVPASPASINVAPYTSADLVLVRVPPVE